MSILAVGLSHRTAGVRALERASVSPEDLAKLLPELLEGRHVSEALLLSTCNRVEVYAVVDAFHGGLAEVTSVLARHVGDDPAALFEQLYVHYAAAAVQHLFAVTAGLDSMVVGEAQILGQVRSAYAAARELGSVGSTLHELVQSALRVGKRVHTETGIDRTGASIVAEALSDATSVLGSLAGRHALVIGAGSMGRLATTHLRRSGIGRITVANRSRANGVRLAEAALANGVPAEPADLSELPVRIGTADLVLACTGATDVLVHPAMIAPRQDRPLVVCDLGLPRDVDAAVAELPNVTVIDLSTLQRRLGGPSGTRVDCQQAERILAEEIDDYLAGQRSADVTPTVTALRRRAADVIDAELLRLDSRLPGLDDGVRAELSRTVRRVVDKLLHTPTVRVKELASAPGGAEYANALRTLFGLDPAAPAAVATASSASGESIVDPEGLLARGITGGPAVGDYGVGGYGADKDRADEYPADERRDPEET